MITVGLLDTGLDPRVLVPDRWAWTDRSGRLVEDDSPRDPDGHGTASASEIARHAPDVGLHVAAVMHGGDVIARIVAGLRWLMTINARIVCLPLGLAEPNPVLDDLIGRLTARGSLVVAAAGNDGAGRLREPARSPDVMAVGSCDDTGDVLRSSGSEFRPADGVRKPDVLFPSERGTSLACAAIAGVAARLWSGVPRATAAQVRAAVCTTCQPVRTHQRHRSANGMVDPRAAATRLRDLASSVRDDAPGPATRIDGAVAWAATHEPRPPREPSIRAAPRKYRDPRLGRQLAWAGPDELVSAVLVGRTTEVVREPAARLMTRIAREDPIVASATDVDLWQPFDALFDKHDGGWAGIER